jgi:multiple sugar transport system permease protein
MFTELCYNVLNYPYTVFMTFLTSFVIAIAQALSCSFIGYGLARFRFLLRGPLFALLIFTLIVPPVVLPLPQYFIFSHFDPFGLVTLFTGKPGGVSILNTWWPFLLVSLTGLGFKNGLYIYLMRQYYKSFPMALEEAAVIDGVGTLRFYFSIAQRLALSLISTCFILAFVWQWSDISFTRYYMPQAPVLSVKLLTLVSAASQILMPNLDSATRFRMPTAYENAVSSAGLILAMAPLVMVYLFTQRFLTENIERTGIK